MSLEKTTELPRDDDARARQLFEQVVQDAANRFFVVLGQGAAAQALVRLADKLAGAPDDPWRVVWARKPPAIQAAVAQLHEGDDVAVDADRGFAVSLSRRVTDIIKGEEPAPDATRVMFSFATAEAD